MAVRTSFHRYLQRFPENKSSKHEGWIQVFCPRLQSTEIGPKHWYLPRFRLSVQHTAQGCTKPEMFCNRSPYQEPYQNGKTPEDQRHGRLRQIFLFHILVLCCTKRRKRCEYQCFGHGRNMNDVLIPPAPPRNQSKPKQPHVESLAGKKNPLFLRLRAETTRLRASSEEKHGVNYGTVT